MRLVRITHYLFFVAVSIPVQGLTALGFFIKLFPYVSGDRLCGLVVRVSGYRYRGLGFDSRRYQIF